MEKKYWRLLGLGLATAGLLVAWACIQRPMKKPVPSNITVQSFLMPQSAERDVDILFGIDNSESMSNEQTNLRGQFSVLMNTLQQMRGGLPNVHLGVVSSDLGMGNYTTVGGCREIGGDKGALGVVKGTDLGAQCIGAGQHYIVDVEPKGCQITKAPQEHGVTCTADSCAQSNCDAVAGQGETLTLIKDSTTGCPRCVNYTGTLEDVFSCYAGLGINGCGFEHQLEGVRRALDESLTPQNTGFIRNSAYLAVIWISDEDDCSSNKPDVLFNPDPNENRMDSTLGFLTSFRCFEFGITCDVNDRTVMGPRGNCTPRDDDQAMLYPVSRYTSYLESLKDPMQMVIAGINGPVPDQLSVELDAQQRPKLSFSCLDPVNPNEGGVPGIRFKAVIGHFNDDTAMNEWAFTSICSTDFSSALHGVGNKLADAMAEKCPAQPFDGCRNGPAGTSCAPCLPTCSVLDVEQRNTDQQKTLVVHWCGEICQNGLCTANDIQPCNYDDAGKCTCPSGTYPTKLAGNEGCAALHYPNGNPEEANPPLGTRDPTLSTLIPRQEPTQMGKEAPTGTEGLASACWYMSSQTTCDFSAGFKVLRADDPPPRTFTDSKCAIIPPTEQLCSDGRDNDQDCLIDSADPDCAGK
ncbi:MAG: hypothetical protein J7M25_18560 [Deltaproteobacteria bacterium]|nr:hypothetical protein [Deltaproteobacteria bacterium]